MNQELTNNPFNPLTPAKTFDEIKVSLASPERILSWSFGAVSYTHLTLPTNTNACIARGWAGD